MCKYGMCKECVHSSRYEATADPHLGAAELPSTYHLLLLYRCNAKSRHAKSRPPCRAINSKRASAREPGKQAEVALRGWKIQRDRAD